MTMSGTILTTKVVAVSRTDILYSAIHSFNKVNAVHPYTKTFKMNITVLTRPYGNVAV